jgi:uncharacterized protein YeeX (DUF496 family)
MSCKNFAATDEIPKNNQEYTRLMEFCKDTTVNIVESKKSGNWIFSKYNKNTLTGLIAIYNDSVVFVNEAFFATGKTEYQRFNFVDSLKIELNTGRVFNSTTINCKYIFGFDSLLNKWLLEYAENKEFTSEQSVYLFTGNFSQNFSLEDFSADSFSFPDNNPLRYKYKKNNYLDSVEIQVRSMKSANLALFKNVFTIDHAEEIIHDYSILKTNVILFNNIAYYLEQMSITMPAITILETIVDNYPDRIVSYLNLSDALSKHNLKIKAAQLYKQYVKLMKAKGKQKEIPQRLF